MKKILIIAILSSFVISETKTENILKNIKPMKENEITKEQEEVRDKTSELVEIMRKNNIKRIEIKIIDKRFSNITIE
jgi:hypothetical protein